MPLRTARESDLTRLCQSVLYDILAISHPFSECFKIQNTHNPQPHVGALPIIVTKHPPFQISLQMITSCWPGIENVVGGSQPYPLWLTLQLPKLFFKLSFPISFLAPGFLHIYYSESLSTLSIPLSPLRFCCKKQSHILNYIHSTKEFSKCK